MRRWIGFTLQGVLLALGLFMWPGNATPDRINIAVVWGGGELDAFREVVARFEKQSGIGVTVESVGRDLPTVLITRYQAGNPPDMAVMPNPGQMREFVAQGALMPLDSAVVRDHPKAFVTLESIQDKLYGIFMAADLKSLVWYNPKRFHEKGYRIPRTWDALLALSDQIVSEGGKAWSIGLESGAASGWPGTDWIEDIFLRSSGPEIYDRWVNHDIAWTDPRIYRAWDNFGKIARNDTYLFGGRTGALTMNFGDAPAALFLNPPGAFLHRQATFIQSFIKKANPNLKPAEDYDIFVFPPMNEKYGNPLLGSGDLISTFKKTPGIRKFVAYLASAEAQEIWIKRTGKLGVNRKVAPGIYPDPISAKAAEILGSAESFRFDGSDLMPAAVGSGAFWTGVLDYVSGKNLKTILKNIEESAKDAYGH